MKANSQTIKSTVKESFIPVRAITWECFNPQCQTGMAYMSAKMEVRSKDFGNKDS